jgi:hypothetical protein
MLDAARCAEQDGRDSFPKYAGPGRTTMRRRIRNPDVCTPEQTGICMHKSFCDKSFEVRQGARQGDVSAADDIEELLDVGKITPISKPKLGIRSVMP